MRAPTREKLHAQMLAVYGPKPDKVCRDCVHLVAGPGHTGIVCELASKTTKWRCYLIACGKFDAGAAERGAARAG